MKSVEAMNQIVLCDAEENPHPFSLEVVGVRERSIGSGHLWKINIKGSMAKRGDIDTMFFLKMTNTHRRNHLLRIRFN